MGEIADEWLPDIDALLLDVERDRQLWTCFRRLAARDQVLLRLLMESDSPHYPELAEMDGGELMEYQAVEYYRLQEDRKRYFESQGRDASNVLPGWPMLG